MKSRSDRYFEGIVDHVNKKFCFIESEKFQKDTKVRNRNMNGAIHLFLIMCYSFNPRQVRSIPLVVAPVMGSTKLLKKSF